MGNNIYVVNPRRKAGFWRVLMHVLLTIFTGGLWLIVLLIAALVRK